MKFLVPVFCLVLVQAGRADDVKPASIKTGGSFDVEVVKDVAYYEGKDADPVRHMLDLYLPKGNKNFPVLFFVHGGGWKNGSKNSFEKVGRTLAQNGIGLVAVNYRLTPQVTHPGHIQDVAKAFAWICAHIDKYGGKECKIFVSGHSAGAHLAALLATDDAYLKAESLERGDIRGVIPISGVYQIRPGRLSPVFGDDADVCRKASPLFNVKRETPPFLILYAEKDFPGCGKMSDELCQALKTADCQAACQEIKDRDHGSIARNLANLEDPATQAMFEFIAKHTNLKLTIKQTKK